MSNPYFSSYDRPAANTLIRSAAFTAIIDGIVSGFDMIPSLTSITQDSATFCGTSSGAANTFAITSPSTISSLVAGLRLTFIAHQANTGSCTINLNSIGVVAIKRANGNNLSSGDIPLGSVVMAVYDGTNFQIVSSPFADAIAAAASASAAATSASSASSSASSAASSATAAAASATSAASSATAATAGLFSDGTVGTPGIRFSSDTDNGFYRIGANNWAASVGGVKVLELGGANTLGITQSQNSLVAASVTNANAGASAGAGFVATNASGYSISFQMLSAAQVLSGMSRANGAYFQSSGTGGMTFDAGNSQPIYFGINSAEVARFAATGAKGLLLNSTEATLGAAYQLGIASDLATNIGIGIKNSNAGNTGTFIAFYNSGPTLIGGITQASGTSVAYNTTSDERLKDFDVPQTGWRDNILSIKVKDFKWRSDGTKGFGISAQQAYDHYPFAISKPEDQEGMWQADYGKIAPLALWGVKDLYALVAAQATQIATLESRLSALEGK